MPTRSTIALERADGTVAQVYCHRGGHGRFLLQHYSDPVKLQALLDHGDIHTLREEIGEQHDVQRPEQDHTTPTNKWTTFFARDLHETSKEIAVHVFEDFYDYRERHHCMMDDSVLCKDGQWWHCNGSRFTMLRLNH